MTVACSTSPVDLLTERLQTLKLQRDQLRAESLLEPTGDVADRAANVEATIQLELIEERIASVERDIHEAAHRPHIDGVVSVGDVVSLDFGDGPESYLLGSVEQAGPDVDLVTPGSPLGRALVGASVGSTVTYAAANGSELSVVVASAAPLLAESA